MNRSSCRKMFHRAPRSAIILGTDALCSARPAHRMLLMMVHEEEGREVSPTVAIIDTQAVKATEKGRASEKLGRIRCRKGNQRHQARLHRDTIGLLLRVAVIPANIQDR